MKKPFILALILLIFGGCSTTSSTDDGSRWYAPSTWFSGAPLKKLSNIEDKTEKTKMDATALARDLVFETDIAILGLPPSLEKTTAQHSNTQALGLLTQVVGPMNAEQTKKLVEKVQGLLSDSEERREAAEKEHSRSDKRVEELSKKISDLEIEKDKVVGSLEVKLKDEIADANSWRAMWAKIYWIIGGAIFLWAAYNFLPMLAHAFPALLPISGAITNVVTPGLSYVARRGRRGLNAIGEMLAEKEEEDPVRAKELVAELDRALDQDQQLLVRQAKLRKRKNKVVAAS